MSDSQTIKITSGGTSSVEVTQLPPSSISLYWVQENELVMVAKGGDTLALQIAIAAAGMAAGAFPCAFVCISQLRAGQIDAGNLIALVLAVTGVVVTLSCMAIHHKQKTFPEKLLTDILARKQNQPTLSN